MEAAIRQTQRPQWLTVISNMSASIFYATEKQSIVCGMSNTLKPIHEDHHSGPCT